MLDKFKALGLSENVLSALRRKGFEEPTRIQEEVIPLLLNKDVDVIGQAQTGTGKTAAFGIPLVEKLSPQRNVQALILTPTRELAIQVAEEINSLRGKNRLEIAAIYGGQSIDNQFRRLRKGVDIVVGTPGRVKDHLQRGTLKVSEISYMILDEADEMLNMGFIDDVKDILSYTNKTKRMLLFSATMPESILHLVRKYMREYKLIQIEKDHPTVSLTDQIYFEVNYSDKIEALCRIIDSESDFYGLVFCRTKLDVDTVSKKLIDRGYDADGLHGDISQAQRERILSRFKQRRINVLVATDVAARGIDIYNLTHVINYSLPQDPERYVHRIGRTGRAGKEGTAITFVSPDEYRKLLIIKRVAKTNIRKEKIPAIEDVIRAKKTRIKNEISSIIQSSLDSQYLDFAQEILAENEPDKALAAFIKYSFGDELSVRNYSKIRDVSVDMKGTVRLFVARGRADNMDPRKLVGMIKEIAQVDSWKIRDVRIFDKFSFITVPFSEAEVILHAFKKQKTTRRPIVERAKERKRR